MKQTLFQGTQWQVLTSDGNTLMLDVDGQLYVPSGLSIANALGVRGAIRATNLTANHEYTVVDRDGSLALEDLASLNIMLPPQAGHTNQFLQTNGAGVLAWAPASGVSNAISSLNGNTASTQTLTYSESGTGPAWTAVDANTIQLAIPLASTASVSGGLISKVQFDNFAKLDAAAGSQTFANAPLVTTPSTNTSAIATYGQVLASRSNISLRPPVRAIDTASTTLPTANPVIDGYTVALGDRVLFTALSVAGSNNRVYKATGSLGSVIWMLETDGQAGDGSPTDGDLVFCQSGTLHADQQWAFNGTLWVLYNRATAYTFSTGLTLTTTTVTIDFAASGVSSSTQAVRADDSRLSDGRTPLAHQLDGGLHTISGKTAGQILLATSATTFAFTTLTGDVTISGAGVTTLNNIPAGTTAAGSFLFTAVAAPGTPTAGTGSVYVDSTNKVLALKSDTGTVSNTVVPSTAGANQFATGVSADGVISYAQPGFSNLSGSLAASQMPALTGDATTAAGSTAVSVLSATLTDAATGGTASTVFSITHNSLGTPTDGFGSMTKWKLESSTTISVDVADETVSWVSATHASRTARKVFNIYDTVAREALRMEANGTAAMIGFLGANAAIRQTGDMGSALVTLGLMSGTPTFAAANLSGVVPISAGGTGLATTSQNFVFAGPTSGAGAPSWRTLVAADIPVIALDDNTKHAITGKTAGQILLATSATAFAFTTMAGDMTIDGSGVASVAQIGGVAVANLGLTNTTATLADNTATPTLVTGCSFAGATYRSVVIEYQLSRGAGNYATGHLILLFDGTVTRLTQVEQDSVGTHGVTFTADYTAGNMRLLYTTSSTGTAATCYYRTKMFLV